MEEMPRKFFDQMSAYAVEELDAKELLLIPIHHDITVEEHSSFCKEEI